MFYDMGATSTVATIVGKFDYIIMYLAIIEWGWVGYDEFCRSRRVLSTETEGRGG